MALPDGVKLCFLGMQIKVLTDELSVATVLNRERLPVTKKIKIVAQKKAPSYCLLQRRGGF